MAYFLLPLVRPLIAGPTPLHFFVKPVHGTGASLLSTLGDFIFRGKIPTPTPTPKSEDEMRKQITSHLGTSPRYTILDNVEGELRSNNLARALTQRAWTDRLLSTNVMVTYPIDCVWAMTSNNAALKLDIARRSIRIRLDAKEEKPYMRALSEFRHSDLAGWIEENRSKLVRAAVVIVRTWVALGMVPGKADDRELREVGAGRGRDTQRGEG